ncbi:VacJ family lipoprotein [Aestuariibius sp. HNIBRBA575]|uniref:MlaA family lipoprotein n=1 Tax=Aestuariibius sp. HNIBRBA575 TaxID=3233343 RepID=UPI0034A1EEFE
MSLVLLAGLSACTAPQPGAEFNDPFEDTNRSVHAFNKQLDTAVLRPAGQATAALPMEIREPVANFADNISLPGMIVNGALQGDIGGASTNTMRLFVNTIVGIGGLFDPASAIGLEEESTDFGETLHVWGVQEGAFIELPGYGPSTERDAAGKIVDLVIDPLSRFGHPDVSTAATGAKVADLAISRGEFGDTIDSVLYDSADSYAQSRLLYLQNRRFELGDTSVDTQLETNAIDPFADLDLDLFE